MSYRNLSLYRDTIKLVAQVEKSLAKASRSYRFTIGERLMTVSLKLPQDFYRSYGSKENDVKLAHLDELVEHLKELQMLLDVSHELGLFTHSDFGDILKLFDTVERQSHGFRNKTAKVSVTKG